MVRNKCYHNEVKIDLLNRKRVFKKGIPLLLQEFLFGLTGPLVGLAFGVDSAFDSFQGGFEVGSIQGLL